MLADTLVARALERAGLCYGDPSTREAYLQACYPGDTHADALDLGRSQSSCLLHARGVLAADEVDGTITWRSKRIDCLRAPYAGPLLGTVEALLQELARQRGLLIERMYEGDPMPDLRPADVLIIGQGGSPPADPMQRRVWQESWGGVAHGCVITGRRDYLVESVDGGQSDPANRGAPTAIRKCARRLERHGNGWWLVSQTSARRLNWLLRAGSLPLLPRAAE